MHKQTHVPRIESVLGAKTHGSGACAAAVRLELRSRGEQHQRGPSAHTRNSHTCALITVSAAVCNLFFYIQLWHLFMFVLFYQTNA